MQNTCILCTLCADLGHTFSEKVCIWRTLHTWPECARLQKSCMHTLHTFNLGCKVCTMFQALTGKSSKTASNPTPMRMQGMPVSSRSCASLIAASTSMLALRMPPNDAWLLVSERQRADLMHTCCTHNAYHIHTNYIDCTQNAYWVHTDSNTIFVWAGSIKTFGIKKNQAIPRK